MKTCRTGLAYPVELKIQCSGCGHKCEIQVDWNPLVYLVSYCKSCNYRFSISLDLSRLKHWEE